MFNSKTDLIFRCALYVGISCAFLAGIFYAAAIFKLYAEKISAIF